MIESLMEEHQRLKEKRHQEILERQKLEEERNPFPELKDLPKVFIGDIELNPRDFRIGKLKKSRRVTKFSRYKR